MIQESIVTLNCGSMVMTDALPPPDPDQYGSPALPGPCFRAS